MILIADQLGEARYEEAVHVVPRVGHELTEGPERVLLRVEIHEKEGGDLRHALAVAHLRVEHTVGCQHVEQVLLASVVPLPKHHVVPVRPVHVKIDLPDVRTVLPGQLLHLLVLAHLLLLDPVQVK